MQIPDQTNSFEGSESQVSKSEPADDGQAASSAPEPPTVVRSSSSTSGGCRPRLRPARISCRSQVS